MLARGGEDAVSAEVWRLETAIPPPLPFSGRRLKRPVLTHRKGSGTLRVVLKVVDLRVELIEELLRDAVVCCSRTSAKSQSSVSHRIRKTPGPRLQYSQPPELKWRPCGRKATLARSPGRAEETGKRNSRP